MTDLTPINWIDLDGVVNMRDLGGLPTVDGSTIRPGRLLRSDNLQDLGPAAVGHLVDQFRLTDVVDLRSRHEVEIEGPGPLRALPQVAHHHLSLLPDRGATAASEPVDALLTRRNRNRLDDNHWTSHYLGYLEERPGSVLEALQVIAGSEGATIVHCAAGKDRTGTVVGLALAVAGVVEEAIVADYAASAQRIDQIIARLSTRPAYSSVLSVDVGKQTPRAESMSRFFRALHEKYDGPLGWLDGHGWKDADSARLRDSLRS